MFTTKSPFSPSLGRSRVLPTTPTPTFLSSEMVSVAAAASPSPGNAGAGARYRQHPPYKEMILNAIESLKERGGSSRRAISKFIGDTYSDLPPTHAALLGHHLRRLKNKGFLRMVKNSYKLSAAAKPLNHTPVPVPRPRGRPRKLPLPTPRPRGRPRNLPAPTTRPRGRPRKLPAPAGLPQYPKPKPKAVPTLPKRKPGRPPKAATMVPPTAGEKKKRGRPPKSAVPKRLKLDRAPDGKRKRGRPRKDATVVAASNGNAATTTPSAEKQKRSRGRPKKVVLPVAAEGAEAAVLVVKRRGRPPKKSNEAAPADQGMVEVAAEEMQKSAPEAMQS